MSHFCVLVTGTDIDVQLAPFDVNLEVEPYVVHVPEHDWHYYPKYEPGSSVAEIAAQWNAAWNVSTFSADGDDLYEQQTSNPNAKWDWYQIGGRWAGFFRVKPGVVPATPNFSWGWSEEEKAQYLGTHTDSARKGDIDFELMHAEAYWDADANWVAYDAIRRAHPAYRSYDDIVAQLQAEADATPPGDADIATDAVLLTQLRHQARLEYNNQPRVQACRGVVTVPFFDDVDAYFGTDRGAFATRLANRMFIPYAVLHDGEWHAQGDMGWFGFSNDAHTGDEWRAFVTQCIDALHDDTILTIVDCHI